MRQVLGSGLLLAGLVLALVAAIAPVTAGANAGLSPLAGSPATAGGELLFRTKGCAECHSISVKGIRARLGNSPDLSAAATTFGSRRPGLTAEAYIGQSIREPAAFLAPGSAGTIAMPTLGLSDAEIEAVTRFLLGR